MISRFLCPLLAALLLAAPTPGRAQGGRLPFTLLGPEQGLPSGGILNIAQDRDGFLWLGTENGLLRWDGRQVRRWGMEDGLTSAYVNGLHAAPDGALWVAGLHGLVRLQEGRCEAAHFNSTVAGQVVSSIAPDAQGRLWAFSGHKVYRQAEGLEFQELAANPEPNVYALLANRRGAMLLAGGSGVHIIEPDGRTRSWGPEAGLPAGGVTFAAEDGQGRLWAGGARSLLVLPKGATRFQDRSALLPASLSPIGGPLVDGDGSLWLPTVDGLLHLIGERPEPLGFDEGLPFKWVRTLMRDREGTLWVLGASLAKLQGQGRIRNFSMGRRAMGEMVWWSMRRRDGTQMVGTDDGAAVLTPKGLVQVPGTEGIRIKSIAEDGEGILWMVSTRGPTLWLRPGRSRAEVAQLGPMGFPANVVWADPQGGIWMGGAAQGILRWDPKARKLIQEVGPAFTGTETLGGFGFQIGKQGEVWATSSAGLLRRDPQGTWRRFGTQDGLPPSPMRGLALNPDGSLWIHFQEGVGIMRVRLEGDRLSILERYTRGHGLRSDVIYALATDETGALWTTSDQGIDRLQPPLHLGRQEGMASEDCSVLALQVEQEAIWVGTSGGLVRFDRSLPALPSEAPRARILEATFGETRIDRPFAFPRPFKASESSATFHLAVPTYAATQELRYKVRLKGLEAGWRTVEGGDVHYPSLPGGAYRFEVQALLGTLEGPVTALEFQVQPPWWKSAWALTFEALAGVAFLYAVIRFRLAALARAKAHLEAQIATRTEELEHRNRELSEALTQVKQLSGLLPICSCCKKIRDDNGYWNQLETYISNHSEADFTHGICPQCTQDFFHGGPKP
ncbi:MAG TPA: two-component regulator propeller domain-containing protein [Holophagaceae bacterium]|nr:two-component regulator propeller domain-containing protein [Holophagaceae bacterium]